MQQKQTSLIPFPKYFNKTSVLAHFTRIIGTKVLNLSFFLNTQVGFSYLAFFLVWYNTRFLEKFFAHF